MSPIRRFFKGEKDERMRHEAKPGMVLREQSFAEMRSLIHEIHSIQTYSSANKLAAEELRRFLETQKSPHHLNLEEINKIKQLLGKMGLKDNQIREILFGKGK